MSTVNKTEPKSIVCPVFEDSSLSLHHWLARSSITSAREINTLHKESVKVFYEHCRINQQLYRDIVTLNWFLSATEAKANASKGKESEGSNASKLFSVSYNILYYILAISIWQYLVVLLVVFVLRCSIKSLPQKWWPRQSQSRSPEAELEVEVEAEDKGMQRNVRPNSTTMCGGVPPLPYDALGTSVVATPWCRWSTKHVARIQIQIQQQQQQQQLRILLTTPCRVCYQIVCKSVSFRLKRKKKSKNINIK